METRTLKVGDIVEGKYEISPGNYTKYIGKIVNIFFNMQALVERYDNRPGNRWFIEIKSDGTWGGHRQEGSIKKTSISKLNKTIEVPIIRDIRNKYSQAINEEEYNYAIKTCKRKIRAKKILGKAISSKENIPMTTTTL